MLWQQRQLASIHTDMHARTHTRRQEGRHDVHTRVQVHVGGCHHGDSSGRRVGGNALSYVDCRGEAVSIVITNLYSQRCMYVLVILFIQRYKLCMRASRLLPYKGCES